MSLQWRLKDLPKIDEVEGLVKAGIISKDEAREIFFKDNEKTTPADELQEIKDELAIIRALVTARDTKTIIREIQQVPTYIYNTPWYRPYVTYCNALSETKTGSTTLTTGGTGGTNSSVLSAFAANANLDTKSTLTK